MSIKVIHVVGARPNYMKIAPVAREMKKYPKYFSPILVHTGQHYDIEMSRLFFEDLKMPRPDINLKAGSGTHARQTASVMVKFEEILLREKPELVVVAGDVNSTLACALAAKKLHVKVAHIEAGLRSFDMRMPEEINRRLTDAISDYLFTPSPDAGENLAREGIAKDKVHFVGNVMIDTLLQFKRLAGRRDILKRYKVSKKGYALLTLHRPENVDGKKNFRSALTALSAISKEMPILFPAHPRTRLRISSLGLGRYFGDNGITLLPPMGYLDFVNLMINSRFILTDSGGIQEESCVLKIPCLTLRERTERPVTVEAGGNLVTGIDAGNILRGYKKVMDGGMNASRTPAYWDGKAAHRIVDVLKELCR